MERGDRVIDGPHGIENLRVEVSDVIDELQKVVERDIEVRRPRVTRLHRRIVPSGGKPCAFSASIVRAHRVLRSYAL
ncbi:hypothetical protein GOOTI_047_00050 [Gordonia otitidis NBRC 100426]|uniref:Transposase n=1 Tax=Gordonia otitidis (strain DSM 44809 / CCUG 52243 / JCM 12355 / NBRC 100426 / IFM 10032) TaxID=1108044 RepID=H5TI62_GORO1|nr:hypothetical protein GOOTI_047_00050 [Gordonia otitidis NBRC 100426]